MVQLARAGRGVDAGLDRYPAGAGLTRHGGRDLSGAQVAHGEIVLERALIDLGALVVCVVDRHRGHAERLGCSLVVEAARVTGNWDRIRIEQIVTNLVTNALKYGAGKPVRVAVTGGATDARLIVQDEGIGLERTDLERIFEKFGRAAPPTSYGGLGLGLYIVRKLVEAHGGRIEVASSPGLGATFVVTLPR